MDNRYVALYRKYRPSRFAEVVGQRAVVSIISASIARNTISHAYLFAGGRGSGKTTVARLVAKSLNCESRRAGEFEPCGKCSSCQQVANGSHMDLIEMDAASNRGIDDIRSLKDRIILAPTMGKYKVYIIDEAHMLTIEAFNALLKTLEEPPPNVVFILCTTEANKIPATVAGRCQRLDFKRISANEITEALMRIAASENIKLVPEAASVIARKADGSLRDAISLLEQAAAFSNDDEPIDESHVRFMIGAADPLMVESLYDCLYSQRIEEAFSTLEAMYDSGSDVREILYELTVRLNTAFIGAVKKGEIKAAEAFAKALEVLVGTEIEVKRHADPLFLVEGALAQAAYHLARMQRPAEDDRLKFASPAKREEYAPIPPHLSEGYKDKLTKALLQRQDNARLRQDFLDKKEALLTGKEKNPSQTEVGSARVKDIEGLKRVWGDILEQARVYMPLRAALLEGRPTRLDDGEVVIAFRYAIHHERANSAKSLDVLQSILEKYCGSRLKITMVHDPSAFEEADDPGTNPVVRKLLELTKGSIVEVRDGKQR